MNEWQREPEVEVVGDEIIDAESSPVNLVFYVSGEHLPNEDSDRALIPVREPTINDVMAVFAAWLRMDAADGGASEHTLRAYFGDVHQHLEWLTVEGLRPAQVGEEDIKAYYAHLIERYAVSTVGRKLVSVRRFYEMAKQRGWMPHNPVAGIKVPRDQTDRAERVKYLPLEAVRRVLSAPDVNKPEGIRDKAMLVLMALHGLQVCEIHRLDVEHIDFGAGEAGVLRVLGKRDKWRTILLAEETREVLKVWLAARALIHAGCPAVFLTLNWSGEHRGKRVSTRSIRRIVDKYLEQCGCKREGISCHSLRHSFATLSLAAGGQLLAISQALGHSSVTATRVYTRVVDGARDNPAKLLVGLLE